ncbi:MAG TPA: PEP/pyruvate-binding domain-containing protein [Acidimicrobiales bacterium]|nr:PEP/pyruvate-binding domain-containing protein [Acidimicrobiales bacterium]
MVVPTHGARLGGVRRPSRRALPAPATAATAATASRVAIPLDEPDAQRVDLVGAKAANLAIAASAGLPVLPGFGVTVPAVAAAVVAGGFAHLAGDVLDELHAAWRRVTEEGRWSVVARSSAVSEDAEGSSMAGRFHSELDIGGWRAFLGALDAVAESAKVVSLDGSDAMEVHDMAIVVQRFVPAAYGGVLFGADPVSGRTDRFTLATVTGGPDALVSGVDGGSQQLMTKRGRPLRFEGDTSVAPPPRRGRELAAMARRAAVVFGHPQDIEWAVDGDGALWLLQSRPVTTLGVAPAKGHIFGPGPVAETFPDPLTKLEQELWVVPLREGMVHAIDLTGAVPRARLRGSSIIECVDGRAAVDLALIGAIDEQSLAKRLDPRPMVRRLRAAWRVGRLQRAMPNLARELVAAVDADLARVPPLSTLDDDRLLAVLLGSRRALVALHGQEILAGLLSGGSQGPAVGESGAGRALRALHAARRAGVPEARITAMFPDVLALVPPAIRPVTAPPPPAPGAASDIAPPLDPLPAAEATMTGLREDLRLRVRWVQELAALAAWELGARLCARDVIDSITDVRHLDLSTLEAAFSGGRHVAARVTDRRDSGPPLPAMFRLDGAGRPHAVVDPSGKVGQGAGGGRRSGIVVHDPRDIPGDGAGVAAVLVTTTLDPSLAASLPHVVALVAETGSVLSHLAILARELGVATVVGVPDARNRYAAGSSIVVDGTSGAVEVLEA